MSSNPGAAVKGGWRIVANCPSCAIWQTQKYSLSLEVIKFGASLKIKVATTLVDLLFIELMLHYVKQMYSTSQTSIDSVYMVGARLDIFELGNGTKVVRFIPYTRSIVRNVSFFKENALAY